MDPAGGYDMTDLLMLLVNEEPGQPQRTNFRSVSAFFAFSAVNISGGQFAPEISTSSLAFVRSLIFRVLQELANRLEFCFALSGLGIIFGAVNPGRLSGFQ